MSFPVGVEPGITNTVEISGGNRFVLFTPIYSGPDLSVVKNDNIGPLPLAYQTRWEELQSHVYGAAWTEAAQDNRLFAQPGEPITYTILYVNNGASPAHGVVVTEQLPLYTSYVGGGWTHASGAFYTITLGTLPAHGGGELTFIVRVDDPFPAGVDRVINRVDIGGTDAECNLDNNWSADDTPVRQIPPRMRMWATGRDSNNIVLLNPQTMQVISNVTVGGQPFGIARDKQHLYVVNFEANRDFGTLSVLSDTGDVIANVPVGTRPSFVEAMDGCAYVTNYARLGWNTGGGITRYCPQTGVTQTLSNIPGFFGIAQDADNHRIFAANRGFFHGDPNAGIYRIDGNTLQTDKIITTVDPKTGYIEQPYEIAYSSHSNWLYVIIPALNEVWVYDVGSNSGSPIYRIPVGCQLTKELEVNGGEGIAIKGDTVYVSNYCGASVTVIRDSYTYTVSVLPYQVYLPLVMGGSAGPAGPSDIYTIDLQPEVQQQAAPYAAQAECTGYCPKGIAFYGDQVYVSLFRSNRIAQISPWPGYTPPYTYTVTVLPVMPSGIITSINQLLGEP